MPKRIALERVGIARSANNRDALAAAGQILSGARGRGRGADDDGVPFHSRRNGTRKTHGASMNPPVPPSNKRWRAALKSDIFPYRFSEQNAFHLFRTATEHGDPE